MGLDAVFNAYVYDVLVGGDAVALWGTSTGGRPALAEGTELGGLPFL